MKTVGAIMFVGTMFISGWIWILAGKIAKGSVIL